MKRTLSAALLALGLLLTGACNSNQSGDSNPDDFTEDRAPAEQGDEPATDPTP
jgi:hypothetical protein